MDQAFLDRFQKLVTEHLHDRDGNNNYGCFNTDGCRNCNYVYNSRGCQGCANGDALIECVQCVDCKHCAYCVGLNGATFQILNVQYTEADYYIKLSQLGIDETVSNY